jgi:hypothetical protein
MKTIRVTTTRKRNTETKSNKSKEMLPIECRKNRIVLSPDLALEIYAHKINLQRPRGFELCVEGSRLLRGKSTFIARMYKVSAKTIRDIWNRKTWTFATCRLWHRDRSFHTSHFPHQVKDPSQTKYPENKQEQSTGVVSFMSVFEDFEFSQERNRFLSPFEESDPFHSDWPYWDNV